MKNSLFMMILMAACCLAFSQEAQAQVAYSYSEVAYYEPTNSMRAYTVTFPDYSTQAYYCIVVYGWVFKDGIEQGYVYAHNPGGPYQACWGEAWAETYLPYDPNAEYEIVANHEVETLYRTFDESGYEDYYNYSRYMIEDPVYYPISYNFMGTSPPIASSIRNILLGTTYSIFAHGGTSGPPHHLKIVNDVISTGMCFQKVREITYRIVDSHSPSRPAGGVRIKEVLPLPIYNSCNESYLDESNYTASCTRDYIGYFAGKFTDRITTGCPTLGGTNPNCGYTVDPDTWVWCGPNTPLARVLYDVRYTFINVNGSTTPWLPPNTAEFYP